MNRSSLPADAAEPHRTAFRDAPPGRLRSWRWMLLAALLLAFLVVGTDVGAQSMDPVLVSNTGQTAGTALATNANRDSFAQSFTTGSHPDGYFLSSADLGLAVPTGVEVEVSLWSAELRENLRVNGVHRGYDYLPLDRLTTLTAPSAIDGDTSTLERFTAHDVLLLPDTTYWIAVTRTAGDDALSVATASTASAVDGGGMPGFALGGRVLADLSAGGLWTSAVDRVNSYRNNGTDASLKIGLRGSEATRPPGPYATNRNLQPRAEPVETGSSATRYAMSFVARNLGFLHGSGAPSFELTSALLSVAAESGVTPRVRVHPDNNGSPAASPLPNGTLTTPANLSSDLAAPGRAVFTAGTPVTLTAGRTYWVVLDVASGSGNLSVGTTASPGADVFDWPFFGRGLDSDDTWLHNANLRVYDGARWTDHSGPRVFRMALNGTTNLYARSALYLGLAQVGLGVTARIEDLGLRVRNESWQWQRGDTSGGPFADIAGAQGGVYVPAEADLGKWLKATVTYTNAFGQSRTISGVTAQPVLSRATMSNAGRRTAFDSFANGDAEYADVAQSFTTGGDAGGYLLRGLRFGLQIDTTRTALSWAVHADAGGQPAAAPLFEPIVVAAGDLDADPSTFEDLAHPGFVLSPGTRYWAVLSGRPAAQGVLPQVLFTAFSESQDFVLIELPAELDKDSDSGWSIDYSALGSKTQTSSRQWNNLQGLLELEFGHMVLRMSVLADPVVTASFTESSYTVAEGDDTETTDVEENKTTVTVTLSQDPKREVTIPITPTHVDGSTAADYSGLPDEVTFAPGQTVQTFEVMAVQDDLHEHDEDVELSFGTLPVGVNPGTTTTATLTITDDDGPPVTASFDASSYSVAETDDPDTTPAVENQVVVTVTLSEDPERSVTIPIRATGRGGATSADYSGVPDELVFASGETTKTFTFTAAHDTVDDDDETVELSFRTLPPGASPGANPTAAVYITDDDDPVVTVGFGASSYTVAESDNTGTPRAENQVTVAVTLSADPERSITIPITKTDQGGATSADYSGVPDEVAFASGQTVRTFTFTAAHDTVDDDDESVKLTFGAMPDDRVSPGAASETTVSITDDDDPFVTVSFGASSHTVAESDDTGTTPAEENKATVTVNLSADPERSVTIPIDTTHQGGATAADYSGVPANVTFVRGETTKTFTFTAAHDTLDDDDESVKLTFGAMPDARVSAGAISETTVSITDDDDPHVTVTFDASSYTVDESDDTGTTNVEEHKATLTVTLSADPERSVTIDIGRTNLGGAADTDYSGVPAELVFANGETVKTFTFTAAADTDYERGESVELSFRNLPPRVTPGANGAATVWIVDDDPRPVTVSFGESAYGVGEDSSVVVSVELDADPERTVTVPITTTNQGGATSEDYSGVPDEVVFTAGETRKLFTFTAINDDEAEEGESVELGFGALEEAVSEGAPATTTITISDHACPGLVWCGKVTLTYASGSGPDDQRRKLTRTRAPLTELLETDTFKRNDEVYLFVGPTTLKQGPSGSGTASPPYHIPELGEMMVTLQNANGAGNLNLNQPHTYNVLPNDDWKDWTLKISAVIGGETTEIKLPFSDARNCCGDDGDDGNTWIWFGRDLHDLATSWTAAQEYEIRIVSDPRSERQVSPLGPPLYARTKAVAASHAVVSWVRPQLRNDNVPTGVTYKVQWKLRTSSWHAPNAVSEHVYTPEEGKGSLSWTLHGLAPDTVYQLRVIATTDNGDSEPSNVATFRTAQKPAASDRKFSVGILGAGRAGETLTATVRAARQDVDLDDYTRTHQWLRAGPGTLTPGPIAGATASSYVVRAGDEGHRIYVRVTFTARDNSRETVTSVGLHVGAGSGGDEQTAQQQAPNSPPTGEPAVTGRGQVGETLTADTSAIEDEDGLTNPGFTYQWIRSEIGADTGTDIDNETNRTYVVTAADVGKALTVRVAFTDDASQQHSLTSTVAVAVPPPPVIIPDEDEPDTSEQTENTPATGAPTIGGAPIVDETLVVDIYDIADEDGLTNAVFSYQWLRRDLAAGTDTEIEAATGETYTVTAADEGKALRVRVSFTDDAGNDESRTSQPTDSVTPPPDPGPSLSDLDVGDGEDVRAAALVRVGDRGRKNDDSQDRAWYATDTNAWHASGELQDGSLAWNGVTLTRVVYFANTGVLRFNEADPVNLGESFAAGGVNHELTIWVKTETATVSFLARDHIVNSGSSFINFRVPDDARAALAAIAKDDLIIIAVSAPDTS